MSTSVETDLRQQRIAPLYYLKIDGISDVYSTQHRHGVPTGWGRTFVPVLNLPEEFSTDLDLGEMMASLSAMEFALNDYHDTDGKWALSKTLGGPSKWDTGTICNLLPGTAANQQVDADATTIPVKSTTGFPSSGTAYIGQETFTYTGVTGTSLTGCTRGLYSCLPANSGVWTTTYRRYEDSQKGLLHHISQYPYTHVGRRVSFWVTTWDEYAGHWKPEPGDVEIWEDLFDDASVGADWTEHAGNGVISETGGDMTLYGDGTHTTKWTTATDDAARVTLDMASIRTVDEALFCAETTSDSWNGGGYDRIGITLHDDSTNVFQACVSLSTGKVIRVKAAADSWNWGSFVGGASSTIALRLYWNTHSSQSFSVESGCSVAPGYAVIYYSADGGAWTQYAAPEAHGLDGDLVGLFYASDDATGADVGGDFTYFTLTQTVDSGDGAKLLWCGRISTDDSIRQDGSTGRWRLGCKSVMDDLKRPLAEDLPFNYLSRINLQGDIGRGFVAHVFDEDGAYNDVCTVEVAKSRYTAAQLVKAIQDEFDDTSNWASGSPDVVLMICIEGDGVRFDVRNSGANEVRHIRIDPDGLGKGEFSHALNALGFDGWVDTEFDMTGGGDSPYGGNVVSSKYYDDYHPIDKRCNGGILYVYRADDFWSDQGDGDSMVGNVVIKDAHLVGDSRRQKKGNVYIKYASVNTTTHQLTISAIRNSHALDAYAGKQHNDEFLKVEQVYIPVYDPSGSTTPRGPFEQLLYPLLSTGTTGYNEDDFSYDDLPPALSLGTQENLVDVQSFLDADKRALQLAIGHRPLYPWGKKDTWFSRAQRECKLFGYALTWRRGKITLVDVLKANTDLVDVTINESVNAEFSDQTQGIGTVVNRYVVELEDPVDSDNKQTYNVTDANSVTSHQVVKEVGIRHSGIPFWDPKVGINSHSFNHLISGTLSRPSIVVPITLPYAYVYRVWAGSTVRFIATNMADPQGTGDRSVNVLATVLGVQWDHVGKSGSGTLALHGAFNRLGTPYAPAALVDITATNGGWDSVNERLTLASLTYGETGDPDDGAALAPRGGEKLRIIQRAAGDPTSPTSWSVTVLDATPYETAGAGLLSLAAGTTLTGWDSDEEYIVTFDDWDTPVTDDQEDLGTWQADETTELLDSGGDNDPPQRHG
jgi:hypothetical protein